MPFLLSRLLRRKKYNASPLAMKAFDLKFPNAKHILWFQVDVFKWQVNFTLNKEKKSAMYNSDGNWLETITLMHLNKIPVVLQLTFEEKYNKDNLHKIYYIQTPDRNLYEMNLNNGLYTFKLLFDVSGKIVARFIL